MAMDSVENFLREAPGKPAVRGFLHHASIAGIDALVLTHGAGGNSESPLLVALAEALAAEGITVLRCDLPFRQVRPKGPPSPASAKKDQEGLRRAVAAMNELVKGRVFLGGQSYGGRQASMVAAADPSLVAGLMLLSYPLHPPGRRDQLRTTHFPNLTVPTLFVEGTRDAFGTIDEIAAAIKLIPATTRLLPIEGAGHGLMTKANREQLVQAVVEAFRDFFR
jgi:hypothetical protein